MAEGWKVEFGIRFIGNELYKPSLDDLRHSVPAFQFWRIRRRRVSQRSGNLDADGFERQTSAPILIAYPFPSPRSVTGEQTIGQQRRLPTLILV
jgi:hypothetical protein